MRESIKMGVLILRSGLTFILVGVIMLLFQVGIEGMLLALPIALIGFGGILAIISLIMLVGRHMARKGSAFAKEIAYNDKEIDILESDERNITLAQKTSHSHLRYTRWIDAALLIFLMVMQVELVVTLVFLAAWAVKVIVHVILRLKYDKEM